MVFKIIITGEIVEISLNKERGGNEANAEIKNRSQKIFFLERNNFERYRGIHDEA